MFIANFELFAMLHNMLFFYNCVTNHNGTTTATCSDSVRNSVTRNGGTS